MSNALACKDKLGFIDDSIPEPAQDDPLQSAWRK
jgi:hypothetical protein